MARFRVARLLTKALAEFDMPNTGPPFRSHDVALVPGPCIVLSCTPQSKCSSSHALPEVDCYRSPSRRSSLTSPPQSLTLANDCPQARTGSSTSSVKCPRLLLTCSLSLQATIQELSDKVLLNIFCYYLDVSPRLWPTRLLQICRKWRRVVIASQQDLHLRLFCTHGTTVLKSLDHCPALPIIVQYGGSLELDPPAPEDEDNIMAALKSSDRVHSISLTVTSSLLENLSVIKMPFSELEDLVLLSRDSPQLTLPSAFGWGTQLRRLHLTRIAFSALPLLLYSSRSLLDLQLHEVPNPWLSSPEVLTDALSGMAQLRSLSLRFLPTTDHIAVSLPSRKRVVFPALNRLNFRGTAKYLEDLVARIDAPCLGDIEVTFFNESSSDFSKLSELIDRIEIPKTHSRADILCSEGAISISLTQPGGPTRLKFQLFCEPLALQLSSLSRICIHSSALLFAVEDLHISATRQSRVEDSGGWLDPINSFTGVKCLHVSGNISIDIIRALQLPDKQHQNVIPALQKLYIPQPGPRHAPLREMVVSFMISRRLSGHPVEVEYERLCHIGELHATGTTYAQSYHHYSLTRLEYVLFLSR